MEVENPPGYANSDEVIADSEDEIEYEKGFSGVWDI
jgi:hypothetical protein